MVGILEQINFAFRRSGMSVISLLYAAALPVSRTSLHRKLAGKQQMSVPEAEALATALRCEIRYTPKAKAKGGLR